MNKARHQISVVVIARNEEAHLARCLRAIQAAVHEIAGAEIVVVDSASTDRTVDIALALGVRVISLRPDYELSPSAGRFTGFHHTSGELLMFVDADTVLDRHWLSAAISAFAQPDVAAVTGWLDDIDEQGRTLPYVGHRAAEVTEVSYLRGIGMYRRAALGQAGPFNPWLVAEEEAELALRLRAAGWKLLQLPQQMGRHERGAQAQAEIIRSWRLGRVTGLGRTLRYAVQAGNGWRFCCERLLPTMCFAGISGVLVGGVIYAAWSGAAAGWWGAAAGWLVWMLAIAIRKRSLGSPVEYVVRHLLDCYGVVVGMLLTTLRDADEYPREVIEQRPCARQLAS